MSFIGEYLEGVQRLIGQIDLGELDAVADIVYTAYRNGRKLLLMGNGGSGATASHYANDFQKGLLLEGGKPFQCLALTDSMPIILAWANDTEYANIFKPQVQTWAAPDDVVLAISGSGNSENVIRGIQAANEIGAITVGLCGYSGGKLKEVARHGVWVRSDSMQQVEDLHGVILHTIYCDVIRRVREACR
jgi:D-sedoheptulose 7-phosphate isomerase